VSESGASSAWSSALRPALAIPYPGLGVQSFRRQATEEDEIAARRIVGERGEVSWARPGGGASCQLVPSPVQVSASRPGVRGLATGGGDAADPPQAAMTKAAMMHVIFFGVREA
jgi:hypothetical protein